MTRLFPFRPALPGGLAFVALDATTNPAARDVRGNGRKAPSWRARP
jgi:hypothetical protein